MTFPHQLDNFLLERIENGSFAVNNYLLYSPENKHAILIDAGEDSGLILSVLDENNLTLDYLINTHGHSDHISGNEVILKKTGAKLVVHPDAAPALKEPQRNLSAFLGGSVTSPDADIYIQDDDIFTWQELKFKVLHCPGHSPGGLALLLKNILFAGDVLFQNSIGRTDFPYADHGQLINSIKEKLFVLPDNTMVLPGHGPATTIGYEKINNPYLH